MFSKTVSADIEQTRSLLNISEVPGHRTEEYSKNPKNPLMIFHGLLGSLSNFKSIARNSKLSKDRRVIIGDLRNHGDSPHFPTMTLPEMAEDITLCAKAHDLSKPFILGHSLGGLVAMTAALQNPDLVKGLIVADIAPVDYSELFKEDNHRGMQWAILQAMKNMDFDALDASGAGARRTAMDLLKVDVPDEALRQFVVQNLANADGKWRWRVNLDVLISNFESAVDFSNSGVDKDATFDGPCLFIRGGSSPYVPESSFKTIMQRFPEAEIVTMPKLGHWLHAQKPTDFIQHVADFLSAHDPQ